MLKTEMRCDMSTLACTLLSVRLNEATHVVHVSNGRDYSLAITI